MPKPLIILGGSARAAAESAARAGFSPWCIDLRGDRDLMAAFPARRCPVDQFPMGLLRMLVEGPPGAPVLFTGPLENHTELVRAVSFERPLLGGEPDAIVKARDPLMLTTLKPVKGMKFPAAKADLSLLHRLARMVFGSWGTTKYLRKPKASFGGAGIEWWPPEGGKLGRDHYLQAFIRGEAYTAVFHADGWSAFLLGVVEQIVGEPAFGGGGFRTSGYVGPAKLSENARAALMHLGVQLTQRLDLRGVFSVDFIMDFKGVLWPVEVNPRYSAACEVLERAEPVRTVTGETDAPKTTRPRPTVTWGKAMLLARQEVVAPDLYEVLARDQVADVPQVGRKIGPGEHVCTVLAGGRTRDEAVEKLKELAGQVYQRIGAGTVAARE